MLKMTQAAGPQWFCISCNLPILRVEEGVALWAPTSGPDESTLLLIVHKECRESALVQTLLPKRCQRGLAAILDLAAEALGR
jgi:hypothetical protein